ncbi:HNH endonuclease [Chloroflexota bacterium]
MIKNPNWTKDELILTLALYFQFNPAHINRTHKEIIQLSNLLNSLPIHEQSVKNEQFRNPNGVYMKMCNFLSFDPNYAGKGLESSSKLDKAIWDEFHADREILSQVADSIRHNHLAKSDVGLTLKVVDEEVFTEGRILTRLHKTKERSPFATKRKKQRVFNNTRKLACEVCGFDFVKVYGTLGAGFAECHHLQPLAELKHEQQVTLSNLAIVCANCHRMIHRSKPMLSVSDLQNIVQKQR